MTHTALLSVPRGASPLFSTCERDLLVRSSLPVLVAMLIKGYAKLNDVDISSYREVMWTEASLNKQASIAANVQESAYAHRALDAKSWVWSLGVS